MAATKKDVENWITEGLSNGHKYLVSVCDTFSYDDYPVYCNTAEQLRDAKAKYNGTNMQKINEIITLAEHFNVSMLVNLKSILQAIKHGHIEAGINKEYCFVTDEDGYLYFLMRDDATSEHQKDLDDEGEERDQWPANHYDGKVLYKQNCGESRGISITETFLEALDIDFL